MAAILLRLFAIPAMLWLGWPAAAFGAQMLMLEQPGCPWCERFDAEIAPAWPQSEEGRRAPLRRVDITEPWPDDLSAVRRDVMTPTFILIDDGQEIARLRGYPGDEFFWFRIGELFEKLPGSAAAD